MSATVCQRELRRREVAAGVKTCSTCGILKPLTDYHPQALGMGGRTSQCIPCHRARVLAVKNRDRDAANSRGRDWYARNKDARTATIAAYQKSEAGKDSRRRAANAFRSSHPQKAAAHEAVRVAIERGVLIRPETCSVCGVACRPQGHHDDYDKPLAVRWLCVPCHVQFHIDRGDR